MRRIIGAAFMSMDGVVQAPGGPTEDPTHGFDFGGWFAPLFDKAIGATIDDLFGQPFDLLLGRRTYDIFAAYWPYADDEMANIRDPFDACTKYVVTRRDQPLEWQNSSRLDSIDAVRRIKQGDGPNLVIQGSSQLYPQLLAAGLIDRLILMMSPVILGGGKKLFGDGTPPLTLTMVGHQVSAGGNIIATYEPAGSVKAEAITPPSTSQREKDRQAAMADGRW